MTSASLVELYYWLVLAIFLSWVGACVWGLWTTERDMRLRRRRYLSRRGR